MQLMGPYALAQSIPNQLPRFHFCNLKSGSGVKYVERLNVKLVALPFCNKRTYAGMMC